MGQNKKRFPAHKFCLEIMELSLEAKEELCRDLLEELSHLAVVDGISPAHSKGAVENYFGRRFIPLEPKSWDIKPGFVVSTLIDSLKMLHIELLLFILSGYHLGVKMYFGEKLAFFYFITVIEFYKRFGWSESGILEFGLLMKERFQEYSNAYNQSTYRYNKGFESKWGLPKESVGKLEVGELASERIFRSKDNIITIHKLTEKWSYAVNLISDRANELEIFT